jgi:hypothetical protein
MTSRFPLGILSAVLALAAPLHAAPAAANTVDSVSYQIERHNQQVTVKDAKGKTLVTCTAVTPTLQGIFARQLNRAGAVSTDKTPSPLTFTLEDQNGLKLWSTIVPVISANQVSFKYNDNMSGSQLVVGHQTENTSDADQRPFLRLVILIGPDGRPISMSDGHETYKIAINPTDTSVVGQDGKTLMQMHVHPNKTATFVTPDGIGSAAASDSGVALNLNGKTVSAKMVTKEGKHYLSFPWNGHNVLVEQPCTVNFTADGDLTINTSK